MLLLNLGSTDKGSSYGSHKFIKMGKKKYNLCSKCEFRHASPTGKACLAGVGKQGEDKPIEDEIIQGGQGSSQVGLDGLCDPLDRRKAVSSDERIDKMERDMTAMGGKLDLILTNMKKPTVQVSDEEEIVEAWTKDIADTWSEVRGRGRPKHKPVKPLKLSARHCKNSSSSDSSLTASLEREGDTKRFARKRFFPKDFIVKRSEEIVHACVKTVDKVLNEGGDPSHEDLDWWLKFCAPFNGKRKIEYEEYPIPLISDSSLKGFAVYKGKEWLGGTWEGKIALENSSCGHITSPPGMDTYDRSNINELELWPILEGLRCWYPEFKGKSITIFTDNTQVMYMLRKGTSTNSTCMEWLREIFWITKIFNIRIVAKNVNTKSNMVADTLSRLLYIKTEGEARKCLEGKWVMLY